MSTSSELQSEDSVRFIEAGAAPQRFARGWHCLGLAKDFRDGKPHSVEAFGGKLVVWADSEGKLNVLDSYCRHMGGDLSQGEIKGDEIACPFHDWRWGGDGKCKDIPYAKRVPMRARTQTYPTLECNEMLFVWHDPEGNPAPQGVTIPEIPGFNPAGWTEWLWSDEVVETNCREIIDNVVDMAHFFYIHGSFPTRFSNIFEGHTATQIMEGVPREDVIGRPSSPNSPVLKGNSSSATYFGPAFMITELTYHYDGFDLPCLLINSHYPVSPDSFVLQSAISVKKVDGLSPADAEKLGRQMAQYIRVGFEEDIEIWRSKTRIDNPLLSEEDGPVYQLRRWYSQFYVDSAEVTEDMAARFEFDVDTTKANERWRLEVADNLANRERGDAPVAAG